LVNIKPSKPNEPNKRNERALNPHICR